MRPMPAVATSPARTSIKRSGALAVRLAEELIAAEPAAPHSAGALARAVGVSVRSLFRGFQRRRGYGPIKAVRVARLLRARQDLLAPGPDGRVTDIAMRWGFFHLGRFSSEYAASFGELPSETLRRSRVGHLRHVTSFASSTASRAPTISC